MREKHPESESQCVLCIRNQPHPRLARGEAYTCGYKPYRCDVCNYSTTTKGNLSIHMQSDRHMNNIQELHSLGNNNSNNACNTYSNQPSSAVAAAAVVAMAAQLTSQNAVTPVTSMLDSKLSPSTSPSASTASDVIRTDGVMTAMHKYDVKFQSNRSPWRCDVCNYETNIARNLRIHMTSEKHIHNLSIMHQLHDERHVIDDKTDVTVKKEAVDEHVDKHADKHVENKNVKAFLPFFPFDLQKAVVPFKHFPELTERLFHCVTCCNFGTDLLEELHQHEQVDRTGDSEKEGIMMVGGTYICSLCQYKSNLKANFQLHCKTDKHLQRLQLIMHVREGGPKNEWRHIHVGASSPHLVSVRCNACDFGTNSVYKLQVHTSDPEHTTNTALFFDLLARELRPHRESGGLSSGGGGSGGSGGGSGGGGSTFDSRRFSCGPCGYFTGVRLLFARHLSTPQHQALEHRLLEQHLLSPHSYLNNNNSSTNNSSNIGGNNNSNSQINNMNVNNSSFISSNAKGSSNNVNNNKNNINNMNNKLCSLNSPFNSNKNNNISNTNNNNNNNNNNNSNSINNHMLFLQNLHTQMTRNFNNSINNNSNNINNNNSNINNNSNNNSNINNNNNSINNNSNINNNNSNISSNNSNITNNNSNSYSNNNCNNSYNNNNNSIIPG